MGRTELLALVIKVQIAELDGHNLQTRSKRPWQSEARWSEGEREPMPGEGLYEWYRHQAKATAQPSNPQPAQTVPQPGSMEWLEAQEKKG